MGSDFYYRDNKILESPKPKPCEKPKELVKPKEPKKPKQPKKSKEPEKPKELEKPNELEKPKELEKLKEPEKLKETEKPKEEPPPMEAMCLLPVAPPLMVVPIGGSTSVLSLTQMCTVCTIVLDDLVPNSLGLT
ncbi:hypothetical protein CR513_13631, partial [Mucuna pruriens]